MTGVCMHLDEISCTPAIAYKASPNLCDEDVPHLRLVHPTSRIGALLKVEHALGERHKVVNKVCERCRVWYCEQWEEVCMRFAALLTA